jgi:ABC-type polysaccharide/polyol phosphate export permease
MFRHRPINATAPSRAFETLELIFHVAVRNLRKSHGNAVVGLVLAIIQALIMVLIMYFLFDVMGLRRVAVRGDFMLYVMSGVFMFMTHIKAIGAVAGADNAASPMMMHAPMNPIISICGAALATLYQQALAAAVILFFYHAVFNPITIDEPIGVISMFLLSWFTGCGIGMILMAFTPWQPELAGILTRLFMRINMVASGKMMLANNVPPKIRNLFDWNPLFHTIDQGRGFMFLNYAPRYTSWEYALKVAVVCVMIGLMAEFFTRQHISASWKKR